MNVVHGGNNSSKAAPGILFTDGALIIDGVRIPLPARPQHPVASLVYDVLSLIGVAMSVVAVIAQVLITHGTTLFQG